MELPSTAKSRRRSLLGAWAQSAAALAGLLIIAYVAWPLYCHRARCLAARARNPSRLGALQAVWTGQSFAYLLWPPAALGPDALPPPLLIDAGSDSQGRALQGALRARGYALDDITCVLLTHGHAHHTAGLVALPRAQVFVAMADGALALGDVGPSNAVLRVLQRLDAPTRLPPRALTFVHPGQRLQLLGHTLAVLALPGHTPGSVGYIWEGGLISGDAVFGPSVHGAQLQPYPEGLQEAPHVAQAVLARIPITAQGFVADGHTGISAPKQPAEMPPPP